MPTRVRKLLHTDTYEGAENHMLRKTKRRSETRWGHCTGKCSSPRQRKKLLKNLVCYPRDLKRWGPLGKFWKKSEGVVCGFHGFSMVSGNINCTVPYSLVTALLHFPALRARKFFWCVFSVRKMIITPPHFPNIEPKWSAGSSTGDIPWYHRQP